MRFQIAAGILIAAFVSISDGIVVTPYGMAEYRLRGELYATVPKSGERAKEYAYSNQLAYMVGLKAFPSQHVQFQFEIGNDWHWTEQVHVSGDNFLAKRNPLVPWFSLAYAQWDPGYLHLQAGIVPVKEAAVMDLVGLSIYWGTTYAGAAHLPWDVISNLSMPGVRIGAPFINDKFMLAVDLFSSILDQRTPIPAISALYRQTWSSPIFILDVPIHYQSLSVIPKFVAIVNRFYRNDAVVTDKSDNEFAGGIDAVYPVSGNFSLRAGIGAARVSNANTWSERDSVMNAQNVKIQAPRWDRLGVEGKIGTSVVLAHGTLDVELALNTDEYTDNAESRTAWDVLDIRYGWNINKNFMIMPRVRLFGNQSFAPNGIDNIRAWPELIFSGSF